MKNLTIKRIYELPFAYVMVRSKSGLVYFGNRLLDAHRNKEKILSRSHENTMWISFREASLNEVISYRGGLQWKIK